MASMPRFTVALARLQAVASPRLPAMAASTSVRSVVAGAAPRRALSAAAASPEAKMTALLREKLAATHVEVKDVSGGCGSFYTVTVVSPRFEGLSPIKQHRCVVAAHVRHGPAACCLPVASTLNIH